MSTRRSIFNLFSTNGRGRRRGTTAGDAAAIGQCGVETAEPRVMLSATARAVGEVEVIEAGVPNEGRVLTAVLVSPTHAVFPLQAIGEGGKPRVPEDFGLEFRFLAGNGVLHTRTNVSMTYLYSSFDDGWGMAELNTPLNVIPSLPIADHADIVDGLTADVLWGGGSQGTNTVEWSGSVDINDYDDLGEVDIIRVDFDTRPTDPDFDPNETYAGGVVTAKINGSDHLLGFGYGRDRYSNPNLGFGGSEDAFIFRRLSSYDDWFAEAYANNFTSVQDGFLTWNTQYSQFQATIGNGTRLELKSGISPAIVDGFGVGAGDVDGDGMDQLAVFDRDDSSWYVLTPTDAGDYLDNTEYLAATWSATAGWREHMTGDFNGDGLMDVYARTQGTGMYVGLSDGTDFNVSHWGGLSQVIDWDMMEVVDMNGDGMSDILMRKVDSGAWYAAVSTGTSFNVSYFGRWNLDPGWRSIEYIDVNGDGKTDILGQKADSLNWFVGTSTGTSLVTSLYEHDTWASEAATLVDFNGDGQLDLTYMFIDANDEQYLGTFLSQPDGSRVWQWDYGFDNLPDLDAVDLEIVGTIDMYLNGSPDVLFTADEKFYHIDFDIDGNVLPAEIDRANYAWGRPFAATFDLSRQYLSL